MNRRRNGREITWPLERIRTAPGEPHHRAGTATVSLPALREGDIGIAFATLLALPRSADHIAPLGECETRTPQQAHDTAQRDIVYYRQLEAEGYARVLTDRAALDRHVAEWESADPARRLGIVMMMEGAEPILTPADLPAWREQGLRVLAPSWFGLNRYAHGTGTPGGLTPLGKDLIAHMSTTDLILDTSHLAEQAFYEAMDLFPGPVIASHSNARALTPGDRQLSDAMIRRLAGRNGVMGVVMSGWMLVAGWEHGQSNAGLTFEAVADHVDHICQVTGEVAHVAIGSDLDGGFGREQCPRDLDSIADLCRLFEILDGRGYDATALTAMAHGNWLNVLQRAWCR